MDKEIPEGLPLKQACCSYYKAFSCSYIFIFYLEMLKNEHAWNWDQSRLGTKGVRLHHDFELVRTGGGSATLGSLFPLSQTDTVAQGTRTFSKGF